MPKPPVAIYARISQDRKKTENGVSVQKQDCLEYAGQHGLDVVEVISENDVSAAGRKERKGFEKLKKLAVDGTITGVVVWHPDRLYRVLDDLQDLIKICEVYAPGFRVYSVRSAGVDLDDPSGRQNARILTSVSQHEIEHKAQRQSRAQLRVFTAGDWGGGRPPTGYKRGDKPGSLVVDEPMAEALRTVIMRILNGQEEHPAFGITAATRLFRELTDRKNLKPVSLRGTLLGPSIVGMRSYLPEKIKRAAVETNKPIPVGKFGPANWPPIIDHATQKQLADIIGATTRIGRPATSLLSGLLVCGRCGCKMSYAKASYKCNFTGGGCGSVGISTTAIENFVIDHMDYIILHGQYRRKIAKPSTVRPVQKTDELDALRTREEHLVSLFADGSMDKEIFDKGRAQIKTREAELIAAGSAALTAAVNKSQQAITAAARWSEAGDDPDLRRTVIAAIYPEIIIRPTTKGKKNGRLFDSSRVKLSPAKTGQANNRLSERLKLMRRVERGEIPLPPNVLPSRSAIKGGTQSSLE